MKLSNAIITRITTHADRSIRVVIDTRELSPTEMSELFQNYGQEVKDIEIDVIPEDGGKSPAERLKSVLYVLWEKNYQNTYKEFETFYRGKMDTLIQSIKEKIN